jgi:hypothetical protein
MKTPLHYPITVYVVRDRQFFVLKSLNVIGSSYAFF